MSNSRLVLRNPSASPRSGHVDTPWQPIFEEARISPDELIIRDENGRSLKAQVDVNNPQDPSSATLAFLLAHDIPPGREDYSQISEVLTLERGLPNQELGPQVEVIGDQGFKLVNRRLEIWINLLPSPWRDSRCWYAGSASTVLLDNLEMLDAFRGVLSWLGHDEEKRCMQIDRIQLPHSAWDPNPIQTEELYTKSYELISHSQGPVRACATMASPPFSYTSKSPTGKVEQDLECRFFRTLSLYEDADYVLEDLSILCTRKSDGSRWELSFSARFFSYMDMGLLPTTVHFNHIPDWLYLACNCEPFQAYGFATDVHAYKLFNPHPDFPSSKYQHKTFSWETGMSRRSRCLHLFRRCNATQMSDATGTAWYRFIYKPLKAELADDQGKETV